MNMTAWIIVKGLVDLMGVVETHKIIEKILVSKSEILEEEQVDDLVNILKKLEEYYEKI